MLQTDSAFGCDKCPQRFDDQAALKVQLYHLKWYIEKVK